MFSIEEKILTLNSLRLLPVAALRFTLFTSAQFSHFLACLVLYIVLAICVALPYKVQHRTTNTLAYEYDVLCNLPLAKSSAVYSFHYRSTRIHVYVSECNEDTRR